MCWAHLKRNILGVLEFTKKSATERFCRDALALHARLFRLRHKFKSTNRPKTTLYSIHSAATEVFGVRRGEPRQCRPAGAKPGDSVVCERWQTVHVSRNGWCRADEQFSRTGLANRRAVAQDLLRQSQFGWRAGHRQTVDRLPDLPASTAEHSSLLKRGDCTLSRSFACGFTAQRLNYP